jgi:hypothetical protein
MYERKEFYNPLLKEPLEIDYDNDSIDDIVEK